jgi:5-formyltetrahydrofolate cyclo-ligase
LRILSENEIEEMSLAVANKIIKLPIWEKTISIFTHNRTKRSIPNSFSFIIERQRNIVSKADLKPANDSFYAMTKSKLNKYIPELQMELKFPQLKLMLFCTTISFEKGHRIMAKGFTINLSECKPDVIKIDCLFLNLKKLLKMF